MFVLTIARVSFFHDIIKFKDFDFYDFLID